MPNATDSWVPELQPHSRPDLYSVQATQQYGRDTAGLTRNAVSHSFENATRWGLARFKRWDQLPLIRCYVKSEHHSTPQSWYREYKLFASGWRFLMLRRLFSKKIDEAAIQ
jgi:hypothetical protein